MPSVTSGVFLLHSASNYFSKSRARRRAFTLVELLVVIGIIALLISILLPALNKARAQSQKTVCLSNLRQLSVALSAYASDHGGSIIPSFNMPAQTGPTNYVAGSGLIMDGWAAILDRDGYVKSQSQSVSTAFYCPDTFDIDGMAQGQTGTDPGKSRGWIEWPMEFAGPTYGDSDPQISTTWPTQGFTKIIRCSYWLNSYNPIGGALANTTTIAVNDLYYTTCVGYGPDAANRYTTFHKTNAIRNSSLLVTIADGVYMGRQSVDQINMTNTRIGYRHLGPGGNNTLANAAFADGHAESLATTQFPCSYSLTSKYAANGGHTTLAQQEQINLGGATVYSDPSYALKLYLAVNPAAN